MKKILLLTDFSSNAKTAIDYALALFEKKTCIFYILHVIDNGSSTSSIKYDVKNSLSILVDNLRTRNLNILHTFEGLLLTDTRLTSLSDTVIEKNIDYIFMGTKGASGLSTVLWGSNTVYTIKHMDACPIIAVPASYEFSPPQEMVFANDYKSELRYQDLEPLIAITQLWQSTLVVVHVASKKGFTDTQKMHRSLLETSLASVKNRFVKETVHFSVSSTIRQLREENKNIGLVALIKNKYGFFQKLVRKPILRNIAFTTEVPLLVLPPIDKS